MWIIFLILAKGRDQDALTAAAGGDIATILWDGSTMVAIVPTLTSLSSVRAPPCNSTRCLASGSPRPVPSCLRLILLSTWPKEAIAFGISSAAIPIPVSAIVRTKSPSLRNVERHTRPPSGVNLTALERRLSTICRKRRGSTRTSEMSSSKNSERRICVFRLRFDKLHAGFQRRGEIHVLLMELNFPGFQFR